MASNQTSNYKLNQWAAEDRIIREEFNTDNQKIETALSGLSTEMGKRATQTALNNLSTSMTTMSTTLNSTISTGLAKKYGTDNAYIKSGSYTGTGDENTVTVTTGFKPSLVMIFNLGASGGYDYAFLIGDATVQIMTTLDQKRYLGTTYLKFTSTGFSVTHDVVGSGEGMNHEGNSYHYIAFR